MRADRRRRLTLPLSTPRPNSINAYASKPFPQHCLAETLPSNETRVKNSNGALSGPCFQLPLRAPHERQPVLPTLFIPGFPKAATSWLWECMHVAFVPEMICPRQQHKQPPHAQTCSQLDAPSWGYGGRLAPSSLEAPSSVHARAGPSGLQGRATAARVSQGHGRVGAAGHPRSLSEAPPTTPARFRLGRVAGVSSMLRKLKGEGEVSVPFDPKLWSKEGCHNRRYMLPGIACSVSPPTCL